ncbi:MAG: hypothetical protein A4E31_00100 [Methanomassiliicoccales archaeon PtaU1.Bin030]|nr:MAG: hypothetical protein A4E31_00100 [Methanomassiliicoccales archaeon PtaU1.Bin030]
MKEEIVDHWSRRSSSYSRFVQEGLSKRYEREGWQTIFTEAIGKEKCKMLDVGTGPGVVAFQLAELGHEMTAVDLSDGMLEEARQNALRYGLDVDFRKGDAEALPFPDNTFDVVVAKYVLWTVPDPEKALSEWHRVLRPGGKVVYVDGNWTLDLERSWWRRRWCGFANFLNAVSEHRSPFQKEESFNDKVRPQLWSIHVDRPSADIEMMRRAGFDDVQTMNGLKRRVLRGTRLIRYGYWRDYFLVSGTKAMGLTAEKAAGAK